MRRIFYMIKNKFIKEKPYFSRKKYISDMSTDLTTKEEFLLDMLSNTIKWYDTYNGKEVKQLTKIKFKFKHNNIGMVIYSDWIEWR